MTSSPSDYGSAVAFKRLARPVLGKMLQPARSEAAVLEVPFLKAGHVKWSGLDVREELPRMWASASEVSALEPAAGDLLICEGGEVGRAALVPAGLPAHTIIQNSLHLVREGPLSTPRYLKYALSHVAASGWIELICNKATIAHLTVDKLRELPIPFWSKSDQERIANFLDEQTARIDALIEEKRQLLRTLDRYRTSTQFDLVTKGVRGGPTRPTHVSWLGAVPSTWDVARIKHVARLESGHTPDKKVDAYWQNCDIPWVSLNDTGQLLLVDYIEETAQSINALGIENSSARLLPKGTVFFSRDATIGRCGIAGKPMACSQHFIGWVCGPKVLPEYLLYVLRAMAGELERLSMGATLKTIGMDAVRTLSMPLPPVREQREIVDTLRTAFANIDALSSTVRELEKRLVEYRSSLISAAVTGQLDIGAFDERKAA